jgi:glycosyltransferase 2 family protein
MILATFLYGASILMRAFRWLILLSEIKKPIRYSSVAESTTTGFAANYIIPARLGELFRIDYLMRLTGIPRAASLGTLAIERMLDGFTVLAIILVGLVIVHINRTGLGQATNTVSSIAIAATFLFAGLGFFVGLGSHLSRMMEASAWPPARVLARVFYGMRALNNSTFLPVVILTIAVWTAEALVLWLVLGGFQIQMPFANLLITTGCATLSTLVPTAPGFLGSHQFIFGLLLSAFGSSQAAGVATATAIQIFCYLPLTLVGLAIAACRSLNLIRNIEA